MKKYKQISLFLLLATVLVLVYIVVDSEKIDTSATKNNDKSMSVVSEELLKSLELQEDRYVKEIDVVTKRYQALLDTLNQKMAGVGDNNIGENSLLDNHEKSLVAELADKMSNLTVPKKYKNYHLLFSRSLMQLSIYSERADPKIIAEGLELFSQAKREFEALDIS